MFQISASQLTGERHAAADTSFRPLAPTPPNAHTTERLIGRGMILATLSAAHCLCSHISAKSSQKGCSLRPLDAFDASILL